MFGGGSLRFLFDMQFRSEAQMSLYRPPIQTFTVTLLIIFFLGIIRMKICQILEDQLAPCRIQLYFQS